MAASRRLLSALAAGTLAFLFVFSDHASAQRTYIGSELCGNCHDEHPGWFRGSVHDGVSLRSGSEVVAENCEACHGPGSQHIEELTPESIINFKVGPQSERSGQCLACHSGRRPTRNFRRSDHSQKQVACDQCHASGRSEEFHGMRVVEDVLSKAEPELCFRCHGDMRADFAMPFHHPAPEGFMGCSSCHEPHGEFTLRQLRTRGSETVCGRCHEETQGPFIFEHPPHRAGGCQTCHEPHGTTNPKMLTRPQLWLLCLECHVDTPPSHDITQDRYQQCTTCHSAIHGSNLNRLFLR